jgi:hypothetical protein
MLTKTRLVVTTTDKQYSKNLERDLNILSRIIFTHSIILPGDGQNYTFAEALVIASDLALIMRRDEPSDESFPEPKYDLLRTSGYYTKEHFVDNKLFWIKMLDFMKAKYNITDKSSIALEEDLKKAYTQPIKKFLILEYVIKGMTHKLAGKAIGVSNQTTRSYALDAFNEMTNSKKNKNHSLDSIRKESHKWLPLVVEYRKKLQEKALVCITENKTLEDSLVII